MDSLCVMHFQLVDSLFRPHTIPRGPLPLEAEILGNGLTSVDLDLEVLNKRAIPNALIWAPAGVGF